MAYQVATVLLAYCEEQLKKSNNNKEYYHALCNVIESLKSLKKFW